MLGAAADISRRAAATHLLGGFGESRPGRSLSNLVAIPAKPDLSGVYLKLDRANEHIETVRSQTKTFLERHPAPLDFRTDETPGPNKSVEYVLYAVIREEPPRELALFIGDAIQNIRNALDYLVYELTPPSKRQTIKTQFPICTTAGNFKKSGLPKIAGVPGGEHTLIERVQPYIASNPPGNDPLAILAELSNLDKHRLLLTVAAAVSESASWIESTNARIRITEYNPGRVKHDAKILAFTATPEDPTTDMYVKPRSGLEIQVEDTGAIGLDLEIGDLLRMIHFHVRHSVIDMWFTHGRMPLTWAEVQALT